MMTSSAGFGLLLLGSKLGQAAVADYSGVALKGLDNISLGAGAQAKLMGY
jgi:hypothetical protein